MDKKCKPKATQRRDPLTRARPRWKSDVDEHDYAAAYDYLTLIMDGDVAAHIVTQLRDQPDIVKRKAKDLLRAADLPLLPRDDEYVTRDLLAIANGDRLSPVLYLRGAIARRPVVVDGYHRICASYWCDPDADVSVKLA